MTRKIVPALFALLVAGGAAAAAPTVVELPTVTLTIGGKHGLTAEIAATPQQRATGLMHRFRLKPASPRLKGGS